MVSSILQAIQETILLNKEYTVTELQKNDFFKIREFKIKKVDSFKDEFLRNASIK